MKIYNQKHFNKIARKIPDFDNPGQIIDLDEDIDVFDSTGDGVITDLPAVPTREELDEEASRSTIESVEDTLEEDQKAVEENAEALDEEYKPVYDIPTFGSMQEAVDYAIKNNQVMKIWYKPLGRKNTKDPDRKLRRELKMKGLGYIGEIWRVIEPHYIYTARKTKNEIVVTYDRSVRAIRAFIIKNITKYEFLTKRNTEKPSVFKPRQRVYPKGWIPPEHRYRDNTMNQTDNLTNVASSLKSKGMVKSAQIVKEAQGVIRNFKVAQYVGVQGYWIRNRRCWDNCYRHKRTSNPETSAQDIWMDCWEEYKKSINNDKSGWEKYASAQSDSISLSKDEFTTLNKIFIEKVEKKASEYKMDLPFAIYATIEEESKQHSLKTIEAVSKLMSVAENLKEKGYNDLATSIVLEAESIIKEAQIKGRGFWSGLTGPIGRMVGKAKDWWTGKNDITDITKKVQNVIQRARDLLTWLNQQQQVERNSTGKIIQQSSNGKVIIAKPTRPLKTYVQKGLQRSNPSYPKAYQPKNTFRDQIENSPVQNIPASNQPVSVKEPEEPLNLVPEQNANKVDMSDHYRDISQHGQQQDAAPSKKPTDTSVDNPVDNVSKSPSGVKKPSQNPYDGMTNEYFNFVRDVGDLVRDMSALQNNKDPKISTLVRNVLPVLSGVMDTEANMRKMQGHDARVALRGELQNLINSLTDAMGKSAYPQGAVNLETNKPYSFSKIPTEDSSGQLNRGTPPQASVAPGGQYVSNPMPLGTDSQDPLIGQIMNESNPKRLHQIRQIVDNRLKTLSDNWRKINDNQRGMSSAASSSKLNKITIQAKK